MEVTLIEDKIYIFWKSIITIDQEFFDAIWNKHKSVLAYLYQKIIATHDYTLLLDAFSLPNELFDYLDGNGVIFIPEPEINKIRMKVTAKPVVRGLRAKTIIYEELPF